MCEGLRYCCGVWEREWDGGSVLVLEVKALEGIFNASQRTIRDPTSSYRKSTIHILVKLSAISPLRVSHGVKVS